MKAKKIMFYISSLTRGGAQRVIVNLAEALLLKGHVIVIVTTHICEPEYELPKGARRILSDITEEEITDSRICNFKRRFCKLRRVWKEERPDLIVSFLGKNNFMALLTSWGLGIPVVASVRGNPGREYKGKVMGLLSKTLMGKTAGLVLQTPDAKAYFPKWIQRKSIILENPLNPDFITDYDKGERKQEIVSVGRLDENKNQKLIIDAFCQIAEEFENVKLILYGDGENRKKWMEYAAKTEYAERIFMPGTVSDVKEKIRHSKIFVLSSNSEGMPNALLEALALGIPSISTDCPCGGPRMLMEGKENGILVSVGDEKAMADAMKTLLKDEGLWQKYSQNAYRLSKEFHPDKVNQKWQEYLFSKIKKEG